MPLLTTEIAPSNHVNRAVRWMPAIQLAALLVISGVFTLFDGDRRIAALFYQDGAGWYLSKQPLWVWLHRYGTIPGILLTLAALLTWLAGFYIKRLKPWRRPCLVVVLTTLLAAGLLVNAVLKQYWGRPRPGQTTEFGGKWEYRPIFPPGIPGKGASFPCGHCTMGFVFLSMAAFRRHSRLLAYGGVATGVVLGTLLSAARVVQGAHFVSDTIWSLGIVGMVATGLMLYWPRGRTPVANDSPVEIKPWRRIWITFVTLVAVVAISLGFMTRRPYYNTMVYPLDLPAPIETIRIQINADPESVTVEYADRPDAQLKVDAHGFGWLKFDYLMGFGTKKKEKALRVTLHIEARSYFAELDHALTLILPANAKDRVKVTVNE